MRSMRVVFAVVLMALATMAYAQSDALKSFDKLKTLAGSWDGVLSGTGTELDGKTMHFTLRVTSTGNAVMHEMTGLPGRPDDPITMFYLEGDRVMLTHYCDAGNRPRMAATLSPDGKTLDFGLVDVAGSMTFVHLHHVVFTLIDANHHEEEWTFMQGDKPVLAKFELQRVVSASLK